MEYLLPSEIATGTPPRSENALWNQVRICDALIHVIRNFQAPAGAAPTPEADFWRIEEEMILSDLLVAEKRIERIELDAKRGKKPDQEEYSLIKSSREVLEQNRPLRSRPELEMFKKSFEKGPL